MDIATYFLVFVLVVVVVTGMIIGAKSYQKMERENEDLWNLVQDLEERK